MPLHPQAAAFLAIWNRVNTSPLETTPVEVTRKSLMAGIGPLKDCPELARVETLSIAGQDGALRIRVYQPHGETPQPVCLYFHGGGWVLNSIDTHDDLARRLAAAGGCSVISVDYRLAPEHKYPAAVEDAWSALEWTARQGGEYGIDASRIAVCGDSAGANLAAVLCLLARDRQGPAIKAQILAYPITDCDFDRFSYQTNAEGYFLTRSQMQWFWEQYVAAPEQMREPYASPLLADSLAGLPPAVVLTAEYDPLRDEGEAYGRALAAAGIPATLVRYPGMIHGFLKRVESFDDARSAIQLIGKELRSRLA